MKYKNWLKNKNLSKNTLIAYLSNYDKWNTYLNGRKPNKTLIVKYLNDYGKNHKPRSIRLMYSSIISILRFQKKWKLVEECRDIKLPSIQHSIRSVINICEFKEANSRMKIMNWFDQRDWLIFNTLLFTGMRVSELMRFNKKDIYDNNKFLIKGKGDKYRVIYLNNFLLDQLLNWKSNRIAISKKGKVLTTKQINIIVKRISKQYFDKHITPHGLRRSYATNLLKSNINLEIVRRNLGHSNINTTSRYIQYTDDEIISELSKVI